MTVSETYRNACMSAPEQFLAVECMLRAAAEAEHAADMQDDEDLRDHLLTAGRVIAAAARRLLKAITPEDAYEAVLAELTHRVRV